MADRTYRIGKTYWVPHVVGEYCHIPAAWPVLGPLHEDLEHLRFPDLHYHVAEQFVHPDAHRQVMAWVLDYYPEYIREGAPYRRFPLMKHANWVHASASARSLGHVGEFRRDKTPRTMLLPARCWRPMRPMRYPDGLWHGFEAAYADATLIRSHCPHRGADLSRLPVRHGCVECPLHGLVWDVATGRQVPRAQWLARQDAESAHG